MKKPLPNNAMILVKPDELVLESGYQVGSEAGGAERGRGGCCQDILLKKGFFKMCIHARCEFLDKSGHVRKLLLGR